VTDRYCKPIKTRGKREEGENKQNKTCENEKKEGKKRPPKPKRGNLPESQ
jgi:hypothetical protein